MPISSVFCCLMTENQLFLWINIGKYEKRTLFDKRTKKINISMVVFFWKYDVKTRCKNFNLLPLFEKNNGIVINKKNLLLARIKNCVENAPKSVTVQHGWQMLYSRHKVRQYLSGRIVWENNFTQHKNTSKNGHKLCLFVHCNCYARQFTHTKGNFCRDTDNYRQQKAFHTVQ